VREVLRARCGICDGHHVGGWEGERDAAREKRGLCGECVDMRI